MTTPDIDALIEDLAAGGVAALLEDEGLRAALRATLQGWGCPRPFDALVVSAFALALGKSAALAGGAGRDLLLARAMRWSMFRRLVAHVGALRAVHDDRVALKRALLSALDDPDAAVEMETDATTDLDVLRALRTERNFERVEAALGAAREDLEGLLDDLPAQLNAPAVYDPSAGRTRAAAARSPIAGLHFGARTDAFEGRAEELGLLRAFLEAHTVAHAGKQAHAFKWQLVHGPGGIGKSRLALELLHRSAATWRGGFVDLALDVEGMHRWRPAAPTLFIIDYASRAPRRVSAFLRGMQIGAPDYRWPVRALLLDRSAAEDDWLRELMAAPGADRLSDAMHAAPLRPRGWQIRRGERWQELSLPSGALVRLMRARLAGSPHEDRDGGALLEDLLAVDPQGRPLFAALVADALAAGADPAALDRRDILRALLAREESRFWRSAEEAPGDERHERHANLLALATIARAAPAGPAMAACPALLPAEGAPGPARFDPERFGRMAGAPLRGAEALPPLEPDLLGELFALDRLRAIGPSAAAALVDAAAGLAPDAAAEFFARAADDYAAELAGLDLAALLSPDRPAGALAVARAARQLVFALGIAGEADQALAALATVAAAGGPDAAPEMREAAAVARANLLLPIAALGRAERVPLLDACIAAAADPAQRAWSIRAFANYANGCVYARSPALAEEAAAVADRLARIIAPADPEERRQLLLTWENAASALAECGREAEALQMVHALLSSLPAPGPCPGADHAAAALFNLGDCALERGDVAAAAAIADTLARLRRERPSEAVETQWLQLAFNRADRLADDGDIDGARARAADFAPLPGAPCPGHGDALRATLEAKMACILHGAILEHQGEAAAAAAAPAAFDAHLSLLRAALAAGDLGLLDFRRDALAEIVARHGIGTVELAAVEAELERAGFPPRRGAEDAGAPAE